MLRAFLERASQSLWYGESRWVALLAPLERLYLSVVRRRRRHAQQDQRRPLVPVLVVGNITVGGTGKTPVVVHLAEALGKRGLKVGVISRGYGSKARTFPLQVDSQTPVALAGDEPLLIALRTGVPVVIDPQRVRAYREITARYPLDVVISDDGLQHFALPRSLEMVVVDGKRGLGNGHCLPAGPLREPAERLHQVNAVWINGGLAAERQAKWPPLTTPAVTFSLRATALAPLHQPAETIPLKGLQKAVFAVAGIANPQRFFATLRDLGYQVEPVVFPDHHHYRAGDLAKYRGKPIITTEKDAVKMRTLNLESVWVLRVDVEVDSDAVDALVHGLTRSE